MDRRNFVKSGATSAASLLAASAYAPALLLSHPRMVEAPPDMDAYLTRIDDGMARLGRWSSADYLTVRPAASTLKEADPLGSAALQSLYIAAMVGDLPIEAQKHPGIQARVLDAMPIMDRATTSMAEFLRSRQPSDLLVVQTGLRDYGAGPRIIAALDGGAQAIGVSDRRREHTRSIYANVEWRLRNQPPDLIVSEYLEKVDRLTEADVRRAATVQGLGAQLAEEAFWQAERSTRDRRISRGGKTMGFGLLVFAVGGAIVAGGSFAGAFVMTAGAVMMLVGLVMLLVGLGTKEEAAAPTSR